MQKNKLNNVIVLKDISSNIVEEAIVVLKPHVNFRLSEEKNNKLPNVQTENKNKTILKEAEYIIQNYISQIDTKNKQKEKNKIEKKYKSLKRVVITLSIINILLLLKSF